MDQAQHEWAVVLRWLIQVLTNLIEGKNVSHRHGVCTNVYTRAIVASAWERQVSYVKASDLVMECIHSMIGDDTVPLNTHSGEYFAIASNSKLWKGSQGTARRCLCSWLREIATHELRLLEGQETAERR